MSPADPSLINEDLAPTSAAERTWSVFNMAALWIGMVVCVPTYMLAGGLIELGMSWWQAVLTVSLGNLIVLVPMVLNGHPGTKYGIPFPVLARVSARLKWASPYSGAISSARRYACNAEATSSSSESTLPRLFHAST